MSSELVMPSNHLVILSFFCLQSFLASCIHHLIIYVSSIIYLSIIYIIYLCICPFDSPLSHLLFSALNRESKVSSCNLSLVTSTNKA